MKKLVATTALLLSIMLMMAAPAYARPLRVSLSHKSATAQKITFVAKTTKPSRVKVTVYRGTKAVRTLKARKSGSTYTATSTGLSAGTYSYLLTASAGRTSRKVRGTVNVPPAPVPTNANRWIGFYEQGNLYSGSQVSLDALKATESEVGTQAAVVQVFVSDDEPFPTTRANAIRLHGSTPLVTLEFQSLAGIGLDGINNGSHDAYIRSFADQAKAYGGTVWIRPFHEFNGDWDVWSGTYLNNSPAKLIVAWKHVHDLFVAEGATNVKFVWSPNDNSCPGTPENAIQNYWPGDAYVDYVGIDQYNFGTTQSWGSHWTPFANAFTAPYNTVTSLTNKPVFLAEVGCVEQGGDKAAWVHDMFNQIRTNFPKVVGFVWFDQNIDTNFRVDTSQASIDAFHAELAQGF